MRHALLRLGYRPQQIQGYANDLRASGYEALGDGAQLSRVRAIERFMGAMRGLELDWVQVGRGAARWRARPWPRATCAPAPGRRWWRAAAGTTSPSWWRPTSGSRWATCSVLVATPEGIAAAERELAPGA